MVVYIQLSVAVGASFATAGVPQEFYYIFHSGIIVENPSGSNGTMVGRVNQGQCICQFARLLPDYCVNVGMSADFSFIKAFDQFSQSFMDIFCPYHVEESFKFFLALQQRCEYSAFFVRQRFPVRYLVQQQVSGLFAVIHRIVHQFAFQLVVFHKPVVGTFRKQ